MTSDKIPVGNPAPDFTLPAASGALVRLADLRGKSHVAVHFMRAFT